MFEKIGNETRYFKMNRNGVGTAQREPYSWIVEEKPGTAKLEKKKSCEPLTHKPKNDPDGTRSAHAK